ncbi:hypothetical protein B0T26DRAFT_811045 [Lasiosphaeria miniovina]|uniref:Uncharacterized protein n=1 Tax=Lasiosphaeria miniovina TaxID=1954250 RepID=A0AA40AUJ8_9PEZI|nr:uncharacterized protein B0T26DRAFT_811045 [Lasiosphaeria miniovina]KAK0722189.1 hypothetical protein B0T26DRAFT_811045 [Lasiosphaeria miniovina]
MESLGSCHLRISRNSGRPCRRKARSPSLFLELPVDIVLYLYLEHLARAFLLLLEKDLGHHQYYCHTCSVLDRFPNDCRRNCTYFWGSCFTVGYHHVRFAMNRHFLGPPNGLPLHQLRAKNTSITPLRWREKWSARILEDELFLSVTRPVYGNDQELRDAIDKGRYSICGHVDMAMRFIKIKDGKRKLTRACWLITVTSYHRLGSGRSPLDVKWHAFATRGIRDLRTTPRDMARYPQGTVREVWKEGEKP